jgi:hypothetical protein
MTRYFAFPATNYPKRKTHSSNYRKVERHDTKDIRYNDKKSSSQNDKKNLTTCHEDKKRKRQRDIATNYPRQKDSLEWGSEGN